MLELVEGLLQHVLGVNLFHTQQVQDHVIGQVEGAVQRVSRTLLTESDSEKERNQVDLITVYNHTFFLTGTVDSDEVPWSPGEKNAMMELLL